ncbi:DUF5000 domain-containing lipoprotein [Pedobacter sp.]|jgi:hypothetical protein|uniref:DUF5000 domain-containing lipoprotein n=1 Tax=Pedobacter sp. TaxID=1411316 RepID=UPI002BFDC81E|nr:DUF5000 domain-containing lipoprotein [Pedobacter sp.]HWW40209.1 DUF5000 domain-containing lipoprotein [Pedobacter sp.]
MKKVIYITGIAILILLQQCKRDDRLDHIDPNAPAPAQVSSVKSQSTAGGAILTYKIPSDPNLSYVKAVYEIQPGVFREGKSSFYTDTLKLEGFGDTREYNVKLYSVGKNEKASEPLDVKITPLTPPVLVAFDDLSIEAGFGGVKIRFKNKLEANMAIVLEADTVGNGVLLPIQTFYTKTPAGIFSARGLSSTEKKFSVYLRDRWNNKSPALVKSLVPLFEQKVPKPFTAVKLPTDEYEPVEGQYPMERMWDGLVDQGIFASRHGTVLPQWFTVDLGRKVIFSRMKMHQRAPDYTYTGSNVKAFEIYGSNNPNSDGSFGNWKLLGSFKSYKPSGLPMGKVTAEDINYGFTQGEDFEFEDMTEAYRFIRFKTLETYGGGGQITISELSFWGKL